MYFNLSVIVLSLWISLDKTLMIINICSGTWGAYGCDGAWPNAYLDWIQGQYNQEESSYPYTSGRTGDVGKCSPSNNGAHTASMVSGFQNKWYTEEDSMEQMLMINPVVTAVSVSIINFPREEGGGIGLFITLVFSVL